MGTSALSNNVVATEDHVAGNKEGTQQPACSTSARARCPAPACLPPRALGLSVLLLVLLLVHLLVHVPLQLSSRLRRRLCRQVGLGERDRQLGGDGGRHQVGGDGGRHQVRL